MNFYDVLAAKNWSGGIPTTNFFDLLFAQSMGGGEQWRTYEGTLPATIISTGDNLRQYQVWGNVGGVGDRTENLCKINGFSSGTTEQKLLQTVVLNAGTYTYSCVQKDALTSNTRNCLMIRIGQAAYTYESTQQNYHLSAGKHTMTFTVSTNNVSVELRYWINEFSNICAFDDFILTEGSTPPASFVPFGYKMDMATGSNILQSSEIEQNGWQAAEGTVPQKIENPKRCRSKDIYPISGEKIFYDFKSLNVNIAFVDSDERSLGGTGFKTGAGSVDVPTNAVKCLFIIANTDISTNITPAQVIAAGIWASIDATTTPIYIGSDPLGEDEYVDYQAGKIYRYETEIKNDVSQTGWQWRWETDDVTYQTAANNRVSVGQFYPEETKEYIISAVPDTFEVAVISADESDVKTADTGWGASWTLSGASAHSFCVTVRKSDNSDITPSEVDGVKFKVTSLAPTDPPVTLPALPTVEGTTIIDYAGQSVAPEKVYFEYKGGKQP